MYSAFNNNTIQQGITEVMADVINSMYFNYFYNVEVTDIQELKTCTNDMCYCISTLLTTQSFLTPHYLQSWQLKVRVRGLVDAVSPVPHSVTLLPFLLYLQQSAAAQLPCGSTLSSLILFTIFCAHLSSQSILALPSSCP